MQNKRTLNFGGLNTFDLSMFGKKLRNITIIFDISRQEFDNMKSFIKRRRYFKFRLKMHFSIFWVEFQKHLLSSLKSARLNSLKCQVLCMIGDASFCVFWIEFEKQIVLFEVSSLKIFNMQNYIKNIKNFNIGAKTISFKLCLDRN